MHSSRMRTGHSLTICLSQLQGGGVGVIPKKIKNLNLKKIKKKIKKKKKLNKKKNWGGYGLLRGVCLLSGRCLLWGRGSAPGGCLRGGVVCSQGCGLLPWGSPPRGVSAPGGGLVWGGLLLGGVCSRGVRSRGGLPQTCPPVNRMTNRCKNITLATTKFSVVSAVILYVHGGKVPQVTTIPDAIGLSQVMWDPQALTLAPASPSLPTCGPHHTGIPPVPTHTETSPYKEPSIPMLNLFAWTSPFRDPQPPLPSPPPPPKQDWLDGWQ